jgi:hypothetical protein
MNTARFFNMARILYLDSIMQRSIAGCIDNVDLGPVLEEYLQYGQMAAIAGQVHCRLAILVLVEKVSNFNNVPTGHVKWIFPFLNYDD